MDEQTMNPMTPGAPEGDTGMPAQGDQNMPAAPTPAVPETPAEPEYPSEEPMVPPSAPQQ